MCIAQEVAGLRLTLDIVQLLAQHQVGLVEGHGLAELAPAGVAVPCTCVKTANQKPDNLDFIFQLCLHQESQSKTDQLQ